MKLIKKKPRLVVTWILSYAIILVVPIICSLYLTNGYSEKMIKQLEENTDLITDTTADNIKNVLTSIRKYYAEVAFNDDFERLLSTSPENISKDKGAQKFLEWFGKSGDFRGDYERAYIYIPSSDIVIAENGVYGSEFYFDTYFDTGVISFDEWKQSHFAKDASYGIIEGAKSPVGSREDEILTYHMAFPKDILYKYGNISFSVMVRKSTFFKSVTESNRYSECNLYLFNSSGKLLLSTEKIKEAPNTESLTKTEKNRNNLVRINHINYDEISMTLITVGDKRRLYREIVGMRIVGVAAISVCVLFGLILAWYFARRDYKPVRELLELCGLSENEDEYSKIRSSLENSFAKNRDLEKITRKYKSNLHANALAQALLGELGAEKQNELFYEYDISIFPQSVAVLAFDPEEFSAFLPEENLSEEQKQLEVRFIITNIFEEIFTTEKSSGYVINAAKSFVCVASGEACDKDFYDRIASYGLKMIEKYFSLRLTVSVSGIHSGTNMLATAYSEAVYTLEYKKMKAPEASLFFENIKKASTSDYRFGLDDEKKLINLLQCGARSEAADFVNELFDNIKNDDNLSLEDIKMLMFDISAVILKIPEAGEMPQRGNVSEFLKCDTPEKLRRKLIAFIEEYCPPKQKPDEDARIGEVCRYIEENYSDVNININSIGNTFDIYPAYLSKMFKKSCGITMVDYINNIRIRKAKEMMESTDLTIMEISAKAGYGHIRTFNRIFKKYEGITPGAYRNNIGKKE